MEPCHFRKEKGQAAFLLRTRLGFEQQMDTPPVQDCKEAAFVVHGGTIMAILSAYAVTPKSFYDWQVSNGSGYVAAVEEDTWRQGRKQLTEIERLWNIPCMYDRGCIGLGLWRSIRAVRSDSAHWTSDFRGWRGR